VTAWFGPRLFSAFGLPDELDPADA